MKNQPIPFNPFRRIHLVRPVAADADLIGFKRTPYGGIDRAELCRERHQDEGGRLCSGSLFSARNFFGYMFSASRGLKPANARLSCPKDRSQADG